MSSARERFRGATAVVGVSPTHLFRRGTSPYGDRGQVVRAVVDACAEAGIEPADVDGFVSYGHDRSEGPGLMAALGTKELNWSMLVWGGGGGGIAGAVGAAASAIISGQADTVAVVRSLNETDGGRLRDDVSRGHFSLNYAVNGVYSPAQICALRTQRLLDLGVPRSALVAVARAGYHHARNNPAAIGRTVEFDEATYEDSRWVAEPLHLFDCSRENDGAAAVIVTSAERARDLVERPAFVLAARQGADRGWGEIEESGEPYHSSGFRQVNRHLWDDAGCTVSDVDVAQVYENFTGPAVAALIDHGFCTVESAGDLLTFENLIAPNGVLPINTSGGNVAEGFIHGMTLVTEAVRQIQGTSVNQVPDARISLLTGGPGAPLVSSAIFGSAEVL